MKTRISFETKGIVGYYQKQNLIQPRGEEKQCFAVYVNNNKVLMTVKMAS